MNKRHIDHSISYSLDLLQGRLLPGLVACCVMASIEGPAQAQYSGYGYGQSSMMTYSLIRMVPMMGSSLIRGLVPRRSNNNNKNNNNGNNNNGNNNNGNNNNGNNNNGNGNNGNNNNGNNNNNLSSNYNNGNGKKHKKNKLANSNNSNSGNVNGQMGAPNYSMPNQAYTGQPGLVQGQGYAPATQSVYGNLQGQGYPAQNSQPGYGAAPGLSYNQQSGQNGAMQGQMYGAPGLPPQGATGNFGP